MVVAGQGGVLKRRPEKQKHPHPHYHGINKNLEDILKSALVSYMQDPAATEGEVLHSTDGNASQTDSDTSTAKPTIQELSVDGPLSFDPAYFGGSFKSNPGNLAISDAVKRVVEGGEILSRVAHDTGLPRFTLQRYVRKALGMPVTW